ncbi:glycoside hydrolase family 88 protein [Sedimentisphaera salicampi]|uniref:glycoside hydrolase family 88 protein n=1 Tax=Sedimentisphaera salicampi TaxID=1941349 RepID=UPI000B9C1753|nr:glycoside hydrolase family 88 protein [Sedimentisphaera salicampi]OXU15012.1 Unsaturated rhamnogalacturonyl hydrolase YteR [Sedimentisphaera salicampi]
MRQLTIFLFVFISGFSIAASSQDYVSVSGSGGWCWFGDPRGVCYNGNVYTGWVSGDGSIFAGKYNIESGITDTYNLHPKFQKDDHNNPSVLITPSGKIAMFYTKHGGGPMYMRVTHRPEDISVWDVEQEIKNFNHPENRGITYPNPYMLSEEDNRVYMFWRGINYEPTVSYNDDVYNVKTWSKPEQLFKSGPHPEHGRNVRPYTKIASNGKDEIHFVFTDGHPRQWPENSIYYMYYKAGNFYNAEDKKIGSIENLPIEKSKASVVYKADKQKGRGWNWDIALDSSGNPVIVYARMPEETDHRYHYARWDGSKWVDNKICDAGKWFPQTPKGKKEREPHYSPGIALDHSNPNVVYLSKRRINGNLEIYRYETEDLGKTWNTQSVTENSAYGNVRPYVIRNHPEDGPALMWEQIHYYQHYTKFNAAIKIDVLRDERNLSEKKPSARSVRNYMRRVADWQIKNPSRHHTADWTHGALYAGMTEWAEMAADDKYFDYLIEMGERNNWAPHRRKYHADDFTVCQMYLKLYEKYREKKMIEKTRQRLDWILKNRSDVEIVPFSGKTQERWSWCDALFMAPPVWAKMAAITGEKKYENFMIEEWKYTTEKLFDKKENLYYRDSRYFDKREKNGEKVFWSRGNGWVMGGLVRTMEYLGKDHPQIGYFENLYKKMARKIASIQQPDGLWHSSLLDPETYSTPESSGSGFYLYALAWGVNHGLLEREEYLPHIMKGWNSLSSNVHSDGMLGYTQPIGADPRNITEEQTEIYGVGAFLLAGSEIYKIAVEEKISEAQELQVSNYASVDVSYGTVSVDPDEVSGIDLSKAGVISAENYKISQTQLVDNDLDGKMDEFLFQASLEAGESKNYFIIKDAEITLPNRRTYSRYVPERKDDYMWENDLIGFRAYGPKLAKEGANSGFDCWLKGVEYPTTNNRYFTAQHGRTYHAYYGEGYDPYHVGSSAGCGGLSLWEDGRRVHSSVYDEYKRIANGPIRSIFELTYDDSWKKNGKKLKEIKRFTIDLNSWFTKVESSFSGEEAGSHHFAVGITTHDGKASAELGERSILCSEMIGGEYLGTGAVLAEPQPEKTMEIRVDKPDQSHTFIITKPTDKPIVYYTGFGWEKQGIETQEQWQEEIEKLTERIKYPLKVEIRR